MAKDIIITLDKLSEIIGLSKGVLRLYIGHYTLSKFTTYGYRYSKTKRIRQVVFILNDESIEAMKNYLVIKKRVSKAKDRIDLACIDKLKKYCNKLQQTA